MGGACLTSWLKKEKALLFRRATREQKVAIDEADRSHLLTTPPLQLVKSVPQNAALEDQYWQMLPRCSGTLTPLQGGDGRPGCRGWLTWLRSSELFIPGKPTPVSAEQCRPPHSSRRMSCTQTHYFLSFRLLQTWTSDSDFWFFLWSSSDHKSEEAHTHTHPSRLDFSRADRPVNWEGGQQGVCVCVCVHKSQPADYFEERLSNNSLVRWEHKGRREIRDPPPNMQNH